MKLRFIIILASFLIMTAASVHFFVKPAYAQTCNGTGSATYTAYTCSPYPLGGFFCEPYSRTVSASCEAGVPAEGDCGARLRRIDYYCSTNASGCTLNDSTTTTVTGCYWTTTPTPTQPPGVTATPPPSGTCPCQSDPNFDNWCSLPPNTSGCSMTSPGGYCDPNGDGSYSDANWTQGYNEYQAACTIGVTPGPGPTCTPSCNSCSREGSSDGCGGTCPEGSSRGKPPPPNASQVIPPSGSTVTVNRDEETKVDWPNLSKADSYNIQIYPEGSSCADPSGYCGSTSISEYKIVPRAARWQWRVKGINSTCPPGQEGDWSDWFYFNVWGNIRGLVFVNQTGVLSAGKCVPAPEDLSEQDSFPILAVGATASRSRSGAAWAPVNAIDGRLDTHWYSGEAAPQWISVNLGAQYFVTSLELNIYNGSRGPFMVTNEIHTGFSPPTTQSLAQSSPTRLAGGNLSDTRQVGQDENYRIDLEQPTNAQYVTVLTTDIPREGDDRVNVGWSEVKVSGFTLSSGTSVNADVVVTNPSGTSYSGPVDLTGAFSVGSPYNTGGAYTGKLTILDSPESFTCSCPAGCTYYNRSSPSDENDFFVTELPDIPPSAWYQVKDADVTVGGDISVNIPSTCVLPGCDPLFDLKGLGGLPGVVAFGGLQASFGSGRVSERNWLANSPYFGKIYDYKFFGSEIKSGVVINEIDSSANASCTPDGACNLPGGYLKSSGNSSRGGYVWFRRKGNITLKTDAQLGDRRVVLLVEGGDLNLEGRVTIDKGRGFFGAFVGKSDAGSGGNITVASSVSHPVQPGLEGIFLADAKIKVPSVNSASARIDQVESRDNLGDIGSRYCAGTSSTPCVANEIVLSPRGAGDFMYISRLNWQMHDHHENLDYSLDVRGEDNNWTQLLSSRDLSSGLMVEECLFDSTRYHPPGTEGPEYCFRNYSVTIRRRIDGVRLRFSGSNDHAHINKVTWYEGDEDKPLLVRGSLVAWEGISFERDLGNDNKTKPAVMVEYAPDLIFTYPADLLPSRLKFREVVP